LAKVAACALLCVIATLRNRQIFQAKAVEILSAPTFIPTLPKMVVVCGSREVFLMTTSVRKAFFWGQLIFLVCGFFSGNPFTRLHNMAYASWWKEIWLQD
jgi:hypothetical protein